MRLKDKVAIVTGAASGIGKEIAALFAREGAKVVIADLNKERGRRDRRGARRRAMRIGVAMDVTDEAQVEAGMAKAVRAFGGVDILVSNAGIQIVHRSRSSSSPMEEDARHPPRRRLPDHAGGLQHMYKQGRGGSIIYMGSVHSKEASVLKAPYVTAKHGLIGLAKVVAKEGAKHGVRANVICPGFVRTPLVDKQIPEQAKALGITEEEVIKNVMLKETVDGEFTTVEDVAEAAAVLRLLPFERADRPVARGQPRLVHAVSSY